MNYSQQIGRVAALGAVGRIGDALSNVKALNPFDVFDAESVNLTQQDGATLQNMGNEAATLTAPAQGALLGLAVATQGGGALFRKKVVTALALGAAAGGAVGWFVWGRKKR